MAANGGGADILGKNGHNNSSAKITKIFESKSYEDKLSEKQTKLGL